MAKYVPGRFCNINGKVYRAKRRTCGCQGCIMNSVFCPNVAFANDSNSKYTISCAEDGVIFVND